MCDETLKQVQGDNKGIETQSSRERGKELLSTSI
jgi:hypothetical protein